MSTILLACINRGYLYSCFNKVTQANFYDLLSLCLGGGLTAYCRDMPKLKFLSFREKPVSREKLRAFLVA